MQCHVLRLGPVVGLIVGLAVACSSRSGQRKTNECPSERALESLHELLVMIEHAEARAHIDAAAGQLGQLISANAYRSNWRELASRAQELGRTYASADGGTEDLRIDSSILRMKLHASACMPSRLHDSFHTTLGMVRVPAGVFTMGCDRDRHPMCAPEEVPARPVELERFWIDRTEVTRAEYLSCVNDGECPPVATRDPGQLPTHPMTGVTFAEASAYCAARGKRLPTEAEWEKAARGTDQRRYPWGDAAPTCARARYDECESDGRPVGSFPDSRSPYGALDMAGSAAEWVDGWFAEAGGQRVVRDDAYDAWHMRATARSAIQGDSRGRAIGFRCAL